MKYRAIIVLLSVACAHAMEKDMLSVVRNRQRNRDNFFKEAIVLHDRGFDELPLDVQGKIIKTVFSLVVYADVESKKILIN